MQPTPSIPEQQVPWDQAELQGRNCGACACYFESVNPTDPKKFQGFCRRNAPQLIEMRAEVPRVDLKGHPVMKEGKPVMNSEIVPGYIYQVTQRSGTCFDGFRAKGTLPGEGTNTTILRALVPVLMRAIKKTGTSIPPEVDKAVREALSIAPADLDA